MGYYIVGRFGQSASWHATIAEARQEIQQLKYRGIDRVIEPDKDSKQECSICRREHGLEVEHPCE